MHKVSKTIKNNVNVLRGGNMNQMHSMKATARLSICSYKIKLVGLYLQCYF